MARKGVIRLRVHEVYHAQPGQVHSVSVSTTDEHGMTWSGRSLGRFLHKLDSSLGIGVD